MAIRLSQPVLLSAVTGLIVGFVVAILAVRVVECLAFGDARNEVPMRSGMIIILEPCVAVEVFGYTVSQRKLTVESKRQAWIVFASIAAGISLAGAGAGVVFAVVSQKRRAKQNKSL